MEEFEGLPTNFKDRLEYEISQAEDLERFPGIIIFKLNDDERYIYKSLEEVLFVMDYHNINFADEHCIDYAAWHEDSIGLCFQNGNGQINRIKDEVVIEINARLKKIVNFDIIGTASYKKGDNVENMINRAYGDNVERCN